jgi:hypothetical protein
MERRVEDRETAHTFLVLKRPVLAPITGHWQHWGSLATWCWAYSGEKRLRGAGSKSKSFSLIPNSPPHILIPHISFILT